MTQDEVHAIEHVVRSLAAIEATAYDNGKTDLASVIERLGTQLDCVLIPHRTIQSADTALERPIRDRLEQDFDGDRAAMCRDARRAMG